MVTEPNFIRSIPMLPSPDLGRTQHFFRDTLHFHTQYFGDYLIVEKQDIAIHYYLPEAHFQAGQCLILVSNIQDLYAQYAALGVVHPKHTLKENRRWQREFAVVDNNGNRIVLAEQR